MTCYTGISTGTNLRSKTAEYIRRVACTCVFQVISLPRIYRSILNIDDSRRNNFAELFWCESRVGFARVRDVKEREERKRNQSEIAARSKKQGENAQCESLFTGAQMKMRRKSPVVYYLFAVAYIACTCQNLSLYDIFLHSRSAMTNGNCSKFPNIFYTPVRPRCDVRSPLRFILFAYPSVSVQIISYRSLHL